MATKFMSKQNMAGDVGASKKKGFFEKAKEHKKEIAIGVCGKINVHTIAAQKYIAPQAA